jgi:hypothetical protein
MEHLDYNFFSVFFTAVFACFFILCSVIILMTNFKEKIVGKYERLIEVFSFLSVISFFVSISYTMFRLSKFGFYEAPVVGGSKLDIQLIFMLLGLLFFLISISTIGWKRSVFLGRLASLISFTAVVIVFSCL